MNIEQNDSPAKSRESQASAVDLSTLVNRSSQFSLNSADSPIRPRWRYLARAAAAFIFVVFLSFVGLIWVNNVNDKHGTAHESSAFAARSVNGSAASKASIRQTAAHDSAATTPSDEHPIEPALRLARNGLQHMRAHVRDYTATITKRERAKNGQLGDEQVMYCKIRHRQVDKDGKLLVPFSVYLKFLEPKSVAGREVIWVENQNEGKLIAHEAGFKNWFRYKLDPNGFIAMMGQRYSLDNIGIEQLIVKLLERGERERQHPDGRVEIHKGIPFDGRVGTMIQVVHPQKKSGIDYHIAKILIDHERMIPLRYAAYLWPTSSDGQPQVDEEYAYRDVKLNVDLTDNDFDPNNAEYNFPKMEFGL